MVEAIDFTFAVVGGFIVFIATTFNLLVKGKITGISGIIFTLFKFQADEFFWKATFFCAFSASVSVLYLIFGFGTVFNSSFVIFDQPKLITYKLNYIGFIIAGFLGGVGTKMANGCTSGHGICGLPRFSKRSWCSMSIALICGILIFTFKHYIPFLEDTQDDVTKSLNYDTFSYIVLSISLLLIVILFISSIIKHKKSEVLVGLFTSILFSVGFGFGGMFRRTKVYGFLSIVSDWDPSLIFFLGTAVFFNMIGFYFVINKQKQPLLAETLSIPQNKVIDLRLIAGSIIFGLSWGFSGLCPGTGLGLINIFSLHITICWFITFIFGQKIVGLYDSFQDNQKQQFKVLPVSTNTISSD
ncbi:hypothetical protein ABPG72_017708 [Tetrahymena utriculariae]